MRENIFARLTESVAFVAVGALLVAYTGQSLQTAATIMGSAFIAVGFLVAISSAAFRVPKWIVAIETIASLGMYVGLVGALIKFALDGITGSKVLFIVLVIYLIMLPTIQAVRMLRGVDRQQG